MPDELRNPIRVGGYLFRLGPNRFLATYSDTVVPDYQSMTELGWSRRELVWALDRSTGLWIDLLQRCEQRRGTPLLTAHVLVAPATECHAVRRTLEGMLHQRFAIEHTTLQIDHAPHQMISITRRQTQ